jgi:ligand-binding SRPBCC domain-containing protein
MPSFTHTSLIDAPVEVVWRFHERPDVLNLLTPSWQPVDVLRREGGLGVGAISEFRLWLGPIPLQWIAEHIACEPFQSFTDRQVKGPFDAWEHHHEFQAEGNRTRMTDAIAYTLPGGALGELLEGGYVKGQLEQLFVYRHQITQQQCVAALAR